MGWLAGWLSRRAADRQFRADLSSPEILARVEVAKVRRARALANPALTLLERLLYWWDQQPAANPSEQDVRVLETRYALRLPEDFRSYLLATMPQGNEWDDEGTRWFPLADIKSLREECATWDSESALDSDKLLVFADYMIWCYAWAIDCSESQNRGRIALITGTDHYVADSFDEFLDRYIRDDVEPHR